MPSWSRAHLRALRWALAAYTVVVALILGWRTPTTPVTGTLTVIHEQVQAVGADAWLTDPRIEFLSNVALFVPFGLLLALVVARRRWWWAVAAGFGYSLTAELAQGIFRPQRSGTVSDVIANTAGSLIGAALAVLIARRHSTGQTQDGLYPAQGLTPGVSGADEQRGTDQLAAGELGAGEGAADADLGQLRGEQVGPTGR